VTIPRILLVLEAVSTYNSWSDVGSKVEEKPVCLVGLEVHGHLAVGADSQHVLGIADLQL